MTKRENTLMGKLWIGTSGIALGGSKKTFPPDFRDKSRLTYYASIFNSIEINSSFYKIPQPRTLLRWTREAAAGFRFTIKLWKEISHAKDLQFRADDIALFMQAVALPAGREGCLLVQLPGKITFDYLKEVKKLLKLLVRNNSNKRWHICIEFRHISWDNAETYAMLSTLAVALVLHDKLSPLKIPHMPGLNFVYLRFHGPAGDFRGSYDKQFMDAISKQVYQWLQSGTEVFIYFNNTMGSAFENAQFIKAAISGY